MRASRHRRFSKKAVRLLMAASVLIAAVVFIGLQFFLRPAKAVSNQVYSVRLASEQPKVDMKKDAPEKYNGRIRKVAYLTFDDGPNQYQKGILDILKRNGVKATFFMIGGNVYGHEDSVKRLVEEGHYPGLHSMSHNYKKLYTDGQIVSEMKQTQAIVKHVTGITVALTRCPYGSMPGLTESLRTGLTAAGFKQWDWTIDSMDWKLAGNPAAITRNVVQDATENMEVVLLHEKEQTVHALQAIIDGLRQKGYEFEVYDETAHVSLNFWKDERL